MLAKRIIPCLDVTGGRVVKGVNFTELRDAGDPVEIARRYDGQGADEITFLDITASSDNRDLILPIIEAVASTVFIPLTVGGGVRKVEDVRRLLNAGADKVSMNTSAVQNPQLVFDASQKHGAQCIVVAIDAKQVAPGPLGSVHPRRPQRDRHGCGGVGDQTRTAGRGRTAADQHGPRRHEIRFRPGPDARRVGCGRHSRDRLGRRRRPAGPGRRRLQGHADAVLAASIFHYGQHTVGEAKRFMADRGIPMRLE
jgi:cyclase